MYVNEYEILYVIRPELTEDAVGAINDKVDGVVERFEGHHLYREDWGKRKLAYPIKKNSKGHYFRLVFITIGDTVAELERLLRIDANVLRFLTVRIDADVNLEERLAHGEEKRAEQEAKAAQVAAERAAAEAAEAERQAAEAERTARLAAEAAQADSEESAEQGSNPTQSAAN